MSGIGQAAAECTNYSLLDRAHPGNQAEQGRFADRIGANQPHHAAAGKLKANVVERRASAIAMADMLDGDDGGFRHPGSFTCRLSGHCTEGPKRTKPRPRTPVLTRLSYCLSRSGSIRSLTGT